MLKVIQSRTGARLAHSARSSRPTRNWWDPVCEETAPFLAKCIVAYRYGNDRASGRTEGDLGDSWGKSLRGYLDLRDIEADGDEGGFENLISQKVQI